MSMPFDWMKPNLPTNLPRDGASMLAMRRRELQEKAALLRRLGYGQAEALRRLQAYEQGEHEPFHSSPLAKEVGAIVESVYGAKLARVGTLSPGT
jgi:hypothetical protein